MRGLRAEVLRAVLLGVIAVVCLGWITGAALNLSAMYTVKATACFAMVAGLVVAYSGGSHPFGRFGSANQITTVRAVLVALLVGFVGETPSVAAAATVSATSLVATLLDGVDGWLARRGGMGSAFGARFDMEVDALLILVLAVLVWQYDRAGWWVVMAGLLRYLFVAAGWMQPWMGRALPPSVRRQTICVVQVSGLLLAIAPPVPPLLASMLAGVTLAALVWSFGVDTVWLFRSDRRQQVA